MGRPHGKCYVNFRECILLAFALNRLSKLPESFSPPTNARWALSPFFLVGVHTVHNSTKKRGEPKKTVTHLEGHFFIIYIYIIYENAIYIYRGSRYDIYMRYNGCVSSLLTPPPPPPFFQPPAAPSPSGSLAFQPPKPHLNLERGGMFFNTSYLRGPKRMRIHEYTWNSYPDARCMAYLPTFG